LSKLIEKNENEIREIKILIKESNDNIKTVNENIKIANDNIKLVNENITKKSKILDAKINKINKSILSKEVSSPVSSTALSDRVDSLSNDSASNRRYKLFNFK
jgi:hypothetical protein